MYIPHLFIFIQTSNTVLDYKDNQKTLIFTDGPRFRIKPYSVQADLGSAVTLMCDVDGNPTPNIVWIHEDSGRVIIVICYILYKN